jgi:spore germination protein KA
VLGFSALLIHILNLRSFGIPQVMIAEHYHYQNIKDTFIRAPWWSISFAPE